MSSRSLFRLNSLVRGAQAVRSFRTTAASAMSHPDRMIDPSYPEHVDTSAQLKEPWGYWNSQDRRNFNETLDENDDIKSVWVVDENLANGRVSPKRGLMELLMVFGLLAGVYLVAKSIKPEEKKPVVGREFPLNPADAERRSTQ